MGVGSSILDSRVAERCQHYHPRPARTNIIDPLQIADMTSCMKPLHTITRPPAPPLHQLLRHPLYQTNMHGPRTLSWSAGKIPHNIRSRRSDKKNLRYVRKPPCLSHRRVCSFNLLSLCFSRGRPWAFGYACPACGRL